MNQNWTLYLQNGISEYFIWFWATKFRISISKISMSIKSHIFRKKQYRLWNRLRAACLSNLKVASLFLTMQRREKLWRHILKGILWHFQMSYTIPNALLEIPTQNCTKNKAKNIFFGKKKTFKIWPFPPDLGSNARKSATNEFHVPNDPHKCAGSRTTGSESKPGLESVGVDRFGQSRNRNWRP